ncbi:MAG: polysaccharide deacetylase family protein [Geothrix sp.]|uniref:polysaccharide deacetylase family protein n=1 Tax=Geothrix sp. TaxID=1962974 RepID=UPI001851D467|nr:polysaccharide deacetylase family protein [Geothrix sp.]NWJ39607.1 polysaccharide deacetylase family protein [Geothrix sp.]WIL22370.1 MAG: polysaccharide deacetylase family protein [Geothrix sp.]
MLKRLLILLITLPLPAQKVALSLDDAPFLRPAPRMAAPAQHQAMLAALKARKVQAILFTNGVNGGDSREGKAIFQAWSQAGHLLANHSYSHWDLNRDEVTLDAYEADVLKGEALIRDLPGFTKRYRYPFLRAGNTAAKRDGFYAFLTARGDAIGHVSIDTADWLLDERLRKRLEREPSADLAPYRDLYLKHLWACARFYDAWSREVFGREIPHVILVHSRLLNGLFLGDVIDFFRAKGWTWIGPSEAFQDPAYALMPKNLPGGEALADAVAAERGQQGFVQAWRAKATDPDDLLFSEGRLTERLDKLGL